MEPDRHCVVEHTSFCGEPAIQGSNGLLSMTLVPRWGGSLLSLRHIRKQMELLRIPSDREAYLRDPCLYGVPTLFPPNRIEDGQFSFNDRLYQFKITEPSLNNHEHGLVYREAWKLCSERVTKDSVTISTTIDSMDHPHILSQFPHHFTLESRYTIKGYCLSISTTVSNVGTDEFPWGLGYHTTFQVPKRKNQANFRANVEHQWVLNNRFLPTGDTVIGPLTERIHQGMAVDACPLDSVFGVDSTKNQVALANHEANVEIRYYCDDMFKFWVFYNDDGKQGYLSTEPYTWVTNAPNLPLPADQTGLRVLRPGESVTLHSSITILNI